MLVSIQLKYNQLWSPRTFQKENEDKRSKKWTKRNARRQLIIVNGFKSTHFYRKFFFLKNEAGELISSLHSRRTYFYYIWECYRKTLQSGVKPCVLMKILSTKEVNQTNTWSFTIKILLPLVTLFSWFCLCG